MIERIEPTRRPAGRAYGYQRWRHLLFLHWPVAPELLRRLVPQPLELDLHDGVAYVGLIPFAMEGVRPRWWPEALSFRFLETNVRTYVHWNGRPGVYFFSLDASSRLAVWGARFGWGLPYWHARMSMTLGQPQQIRYHSQRGRAGPRLAVCYEPGPPLGPSQPGTIDHFLLERYLLFVSRSGELYEGQVHHPPYPAHRARLVEFHDELVAAAGLPPVESPPAWLHYSPGVDVEVFPLRRLTVPERTEPLPGVVGQTP